MSVIKQLLSDITRFFAGQFPMSGANVQACKTDPFMRTRRKYWSRTLKILALHGLNIGENV